MAERSAAFEVLVRRFEKRDQGRGVPPLETEEIDSERSVHKFVTEPARVRRAYGVTINLGNYESARVDVDITLPCYAEEVRDADELVMQLCEERLEEEVAKFRQEGVAVPKAVAARLQKVAPKVATPKGRGI
jgi:hypothetical protein